MCSIRTTSSIYRQLAGGITAALTIHGSANPIGGQAALIKPRWGVAGPDSLLMAGAPPVIKFALGENVTQSNHPRTTGRYPNSRMGVEQFFRDWFAAARNYRDKWDAYQAQSRAGRPAVPRGGTCAWSRWSECWRAGSRSTATPTARTRSWRCCGWPRNWASRSMCWSMCWRATRWPRRSAPTARCPPLSAIGGPTSSRSTMRSPTMGR